MRFTRKILLLILLCLAVGIVFMSANDNKLLVMQQQEYYVRVINGFTNNSSLPLVIWCSTGGGDDMGGRALQEGDDFSWSLRTKFWGSNVFLCTMKWDGRRRKFDAFKVPRDIQRCRPPLRRCSWLVTEDGFYFSSDEVNWNKDFSWS